jgi:hypothetical protein
MQYAKQVRTLLGVFLRKEMMKSKGKPIILLCNVGPAPQAITQALDVITPEGGGPKNGVVVVARQHHAPIEEPADLAKSRFVELCASCLNALNEITFDTHAPISEGLSEVMIDASRHRLCIGLCVVQLTPREFFFYAMYALFRVQERNGDGTLSLNELTVEDFDTTLRRITQACGKELTVETCYRSKHFKFLLEMVEQMTSGSRKRDLDVQDFKEKLRVTFARIKRKIRDAGVPARYAIVLHKERGEACYRLSIPPEKIRFVEHEEDSVSKVAGQNNPSLAA